MISVKVSSRTTLYIDLQDDTIPNKGGFYCKVYRDNSTDFPFGEFTIDKNLVRGENRRERGIRYATMRVKEMYH